MKQRNHRNSRRKVEREDIESGVQLQSRESEEDFGNGNGRTHNIIGFQFIGWLHDIKISLTLCNFCSLKIYNTAHTLFLLSIRKPVNTPYTGMFRLCHGDLFLACVSH